MILTRSHPDIIGVRKRTIARSISIGPLSFHFVTIALLSVLALFYVIQSSRGESASLKANELINEKEKLQVEMKRLELESIRLRSLQEIKKNSSTLEPVQKINHLPEDTTATLHDSQ